MDPVSFTASLITVGALAAASSKKIHDLRGKLKNAPKDVESLLEQVDTFESLLTELKTQLQDHRNSAPTQDTLQKVWGSSIAQMNRDVQSLQAILSKVEPLFRKKSKTSRILLVARQMLSEKEVEQYWRKIDTHCHTLMSVQDMVHGRKLGKVSESIIALGDQEKAGLRAVSSQISQSTSRLSSEVKTGVSTVSSQVTVSESANAARHQAVLAHLDSHTERDNINTGKIDEVFQQQVRSMDINEAGLQAIHSGLVNATSTSLEEHKTTHAMLRQCQSQMQTLVRNRVTFGTVEQSLRSASTHTRASGPTTLKTFVFWSYFHYRMPIGMLEIHMKKSREKKMSRHSAPRVCTVSEIAVEFVPPPWLSRVAINYSMKLTCDLISSQWHWGAKLEPLTVNCNLFFNNAIDNLDVEGVRISFAEGLAKPTDYVLDECGSPEPWYSKKTNTMWFNAPPNFEDEDMAHRYYLMLDFMIETGLPGQDDFMIAFSKMLNHCQGNQELLKTQMLNYSETHGGAILEVQSNVLEQVFMIHNSGHIDWIRDILIHSAETLLVDDLSPLAICLLGTLAHVDAPFRAHLKEKIASCRSSLSIGRTAYADYLFETTFSLASVESHFRALKNNEINGFLGFICRQGSVPMIKIFLDIGVDVIGVDEIKRSTLLGIAAAEGNMGVLHTLLEAGANGSSALRHFLGSRKRLSDEDFRCILRLLVDNARPQSNPKSKDPLKGILMSSRALSSYPEAPQILLDRKIFKMKYSGEGYPSFDDSKYMFQAISTRNSSMLDLLLRNGAHANAQVISSSRYHFRWLKSCTWITFSMILGAASCTDILIRHGADVTALDGAGRSALRLAKDLALGSHPRRVDPIYWPIAYRRCRDITAQEDAETLAVVERAFNDKYQGTKTLEDYYNLSEHLTLQPSPPPAKPASLLQKTYNKALTIFLTPTQIELLHDHLSDLSYHIRKFWSLSFHEALFIRSIYILSYTLLLAIELHALIKGQKRLQMPSRYFLSALALLALALIGGSSLLGYSWDSFVTGSKAEIES